MAAPEFEPMSVGRIVDRTFSLYKRNFVRFVTIVSVVSVPIWALTLVGGYVLGRMAGTSSTVGVATIAGPVLAALLFVLAQILSNAALLRSVSGFYLGTEVTVGEAYRSVLPKLVTLIAAGILVWIVTMIGFVLLIVPGIIFSLWLALTAPAIVIEDLSATRGMGRSRRLASGNLGKVFGVLFIAGLIGMIVSWIFSFAGMFVASRLGELNEIGPVMVNQLFALVGRIVVAPIGATATILLYYDLRIRKEGFDLEMLAQTLGAQGNTSDPQGLIG